MYLVLSSPIVQGKQILKNQEEQPKFHDTKIQEDKTSFTEPTLSFNKKKKKKAKKTPIKDTNPWGFTDIFFLLAFTETSDNLAI